MFWLRTLSWPIAMAVALAGPPASHATPAKATYIRHQDYVCRKYDAKLAALPYPKGLSEAQYRRIGKLIYRIFGDYDKALTKTRRPASAKKFMTAWTGARKAAQRWAKEAQLWGAAVIVRSDLNTRWKSANIAFGKASAAYGLKNCGVRFRAGHLPGAPQ